MESWPGGIGTITLFVADLDRTKAFYQEVFGLPVHYQDEASAVFRFGGTQVNLLRETDAPELIEPAGIAAADAGSRMMLTIDVEDVDATCAELTRRGAVILNGPIDRRWGVRTASFADPGGHIWEVASPIGSSSGD